MVLVFQVASNVSQTCSGSKIQGVKTHQQSYQVGILKEEVNKLLTHSHPSPPKKGTNKTWCRFCKLHPPLFLKPCVFSTVVFVVSNPFFAFKRRQKIGRVFRHNRTEVGDFKEVVLIYMVTRRIIDLLVPWVGRPPSRALVALMGSHPSLGLGRRWYL